MSLSDNWRFAVNRREQGLVQRPPEYLFKTVGWQITRPVVKQL